MSENKNYVYRLMRAKCSEGTIYNYLNVDKDHGVLAMDDQQPLLNANDHTNKNVIHFGNCESNRNPEMLLRKGIMTVVGGGIGFLLGEVLDAVGIMAVKCKPQTPVPWECGNESNCLDGAPALTLQSELACRNGGIIALLPLEPPPIDGDVHTSAPEEQPISEESPYTVVQNNINDAMQSALDKVQQTGAVDAEIIARVEAALIVSTAMPPNPQDTDANAILLTPEQLDQYYSMDGSFATNIFGAIDSISDPVLADERVRNYYNNLRAFPENLYDDNGMIVNQYLMTERVMNNATLAHSGCGAIAVYNTIKIFDGATSDPNLAHIVYHLEPYGVGNNVLGVLPNGVTNYLNEQGYATTIVTGEENIKAESEKAKAGIILYATMENTHYVAYKPIARKNGDDSEQEYIFYNDKIDKKTNIGTMEEFNEMLENKIEIGKIAIIIEEIPKSDNLNE